MIDLDRGLFILRTITRHTSASPVTGADVAATTGSDPRQVAEAVSIAVARGIRIASNAKGYFRPSPVETQEFLEREKRRLISLATKISQAKKNAGNEFSLFEQGKGEAA